MQQIRLNQAEESQIKMEKSDSVRWLVLPPHHRAYESRNHITGCSRAQSSHLQQEGDGTEDSGQSTSAGGGVDSTAVESGLGSSRGGGGRAGGTSTGGDQGGGSGSDGDDGGGGDGGGGALVALGHSLGDQRAGDGEGAGHGDVAGGRDAVGRTTVDDGGSLRAVGGVSSDGLGDSVGSDNTGSQGGDNSSEGETHFDWNVGLMRGM